MTPLILKPVIIGMGFSKKTTAIDLKQTLDNILQYNQYLLKGLAIPAFKQQDDNAVLLQTLINIPVHYISYENLKTFQSQCQSFSTITAKHTELGAIAEACVLAIIQKNDYLLIPKMIYNGISFSIAIKGDLS